MGVAKTFTSSPMSFSRGQNYYGTPKTSSFHYSCYFLEISGFFFFLAEDWKIVLLLTFVTFQNDMFDNIRLR